MQQQYSEVQSVGGYVPENIVTNDDLAKKMDTSDEWIKERSGIEQRRFADKTTATSDLGTLAAKNALEKVAENPANLDLIIAATLSPDYYFPGIGVLIQNKLGATCPAMDLRGQCSGFSWAISTADALISSGKYHNVLIVGAEVHSQLIELSNRGRNVSVLFGDGAGALLLKSKSQTPKPSPQNQTRGVIDSLMGSDGSQAEILAITRPGMSGKGTFLTQKEADEKAYLPYMEGQQVFKHAVTRLTKVAQDLLAKNSLSPSDLDLMIPHQANLRINQMVARKLGLKSTQVFNNIQKYGNTTSASIPLCLKEAEEKGVLKKGHLIMTVAFGSGFTWGANLIRW